VSARNAKAGGRVNAKRAEIPARPALTTAQAEQMKNMRKEDLPEEMGMVRITYILPPSPSLLKDPKLRLAQYWEFLKQYFMEWPQAIISKFLFWRGVPTRLRPSHLKKHPLYRSPRIDLDILHHSRIIKDLHKRSYLAIQEAASTGSLRGIRETCGASLTEHYTRMASSYKTRKEIVKWDVRYKPWPMGIRILSRKFGQAPITFNNLPVGSQQVIARIRSSQTLTPGHIIGRLPNGQNEVAWGKPKTREMVETVIMQRKYVAGVFEPWKIFGFQSPKGTRGELEAWKEDQLRIPGVKGSGVDGKENASAAKGVAA